LIWSGFSRSGPVLQTSAKGASLETVETYFYRLDVLPVMKPLRER